MPRTARASLSGWTDHMLNRRNAPAQVFHKPEDYYAFPEMRAAATIHVSHS